MNAKELWDEVKRQMEGEPLTLGWKTSATIFGMNDEVLHTGMYPMACYIMALGCGKKKRIGGQH